jgi:hypothetical protein
MSSTVGRVVAAVGLATLLAPSAALASWWDGGYQPARREQPPPERPQPAPAPPAPGAPDQPPAGSLPSIYGCENSDLPGTAPVLHKDTTPPPGTPVAPGQEITVDITWRVSDWVAPDLHKALDCVYINNRYVPELSGGERPTPNDGHFAYRYIVPAEVPPGSTICDRGFVSGPNGAEDYAREISNLVCFPVGPPPGPPAPSASPAPPPPPPPETATTVTTAPTTTTTEQPASEGQRLRRQAPGMPRATPAALPQELPRTGGDPGPGRLAAGALGVAVLLGGGRRRRDPRRLGRS